MSSLQQLADAVVPDVTALYSARDGPAVKNILLRRYDDGAVFEDGAVVLRNASGDLLPQFSSLKIFPQVSVTVVGAPQATALASNRAKIDFQNRQSYSLPGGLAATVSLLVDTTLTVDSASGKVLEHVDRWRTVGIGGGAASVPVLLTPPRFVRSLLGRLSSSAMRAAGVGSGGGGGVAAGEATVAAGRAGVRDKIRSLLRVKAD